MAGYPPPYPPPGAPSGSPFGFDPRQQARFARRQFQDQIRAQKLAARAQRDLYRQQYRAMRRSSLLGPILLVSIGVVLLYIRLGNLPLYTFEAWYGRWWPVVFLGAGVVLVLEWAFDHRSTQEGVPFIRRGVGAGPIFLLILLALTGVSIQSMHDGIGVLAHGLHIDSNNVGEFFGERHDFEQQIDQPFTAGTTLSVDNPRGDVTITGKSVDNQIHVVVNKQVYAWNVAGNGNDANSRADQISPRISLVGQTLSISVPNLEAASADLSITLPEATPVTISANHGDVTVSDLRAAVNVTSNHGDIELDRIGGAVVVHTSSSSTSFTAHGVQGDVMLRGHADDMTVTDVTGSTSLEGEFYGDTHLEHLIGPVGFRTGRTQFSVARLDGMIDISSDEEMTGSQLVGPTELHTRSRNISFERASGSVHITNTNGSVDLSDAAPLGNISVENTNGEVTVTVPDHAGLTIETLTKDGAIHDDLDNTSIPDNANNTYSNTIGNGAAHLTLHTTHADINIHKGIVEAPVAPAPPIPPTGPAPVGAAPAVSAPKPVAPKHHKPTAAVPAVPAVPEHPAE